MNNIKPRILLFIPCYHCEAQLPHVIEKIDFQIQACIDEILIIDNNSSDQTFSVAQSAVQPLTVKTTLIRNHENCNLGGSLKKAFLYALEHQYDFMVILHGDDQADIREFIPIMSDPDHLTYDMVIGSRFHPKSQLKGYGLIRTWGNRFLNLFCGLMVQKKMYDLIAGLNMFKLDFFREKWFLNFPDDLTFDAHVLLYGLSQNAKISYVPITWRSEGQISNAHVVKQAYIIMKLWLKYALYGKAIFT